jgi:MYXO-CTERM domain-containing protein
VQLSVEATIYTLLDPDCIVVTTPEGDRCLVPPYDGRASLLVDPYVYIDPTWPHASWFEVQTTSDQANDTWVAVKRTSVDPNAFGIGADGGIPDGGVPDAGQDADAAIEMDSGMDSGVPGASNGGGCAVSTGHESAPGSAALSILAWVLALHRRTRRDPRTS